MFILSLHHYLSTPEPTPKLARTEMLQHKKNPKVTCNMLQLETIFVSNFAFPLLPTVSPLKSLQRYIHIFRKRDFWHRSPLIFFGKIPYMPPPPRIHGQIKAIYIYCAKWIAVLMLYKWPYKLNFTKIYFKLGLHWSASVFNFAPNKSQFKLNLNLNWIETEHPLGGHSV